MNNFTQADFDQHAKDFMSDLNTIISIDPDYKARVGGTTIELELVEFGKRVFGASIDLYAHHDFSTKEREFKISKGSMGAFNLECDASVASYKAIAEIINNFVEVKNLAIDYMERYEIMSYHNLF